MRKKFVAISILSLTLASALAEPPSAPTRLVNPFIGTAPNTYTHDGYAWDTGNVFPGAVAPRGMVEWSPDTTHQNQIAGGYWYPDKSIQEFSLTHFSGRGVPCLKDIPFLPVIGPVDGSPGTNWTRFAAFFSHDQENASPGYYRVTFDNGIKTELTATPHSGMARFTFPNAWAGKTQATLLLRSDTAISVHGNEINGYRVGKIGGADRTYIVYFFADFDRPFASVQTWAGGTVTGQPDANDPHCGAILAFDTATNPVVQVRVGLSYVSVDNAKENLLKENPGWDFAAVRQKTDDAWNKELSRIQIEGGTEAQQQTFYTALYHCFMQPNLLDDVSGEYRGMDEKVHKVKRGHHQYQGIPAWDQWRSYAPLMAILTPDVSSDIDQSLVNYAQQDAAARPTGGGLPRWQQVYRNSGGMVGDGDDAIIAWSYAFGATNFDTQHALEAMDKGASVPGTTSDGFAVRSGLKDYLRLGYVPGEASVTLEYCNADFALSQFALALGDTNKFLRYQKQQDNWTNLFDVATGLIRPRDADGQWMENFSGKTHKGFVEGTAAQYVWMASFDQPLFTNLMLSLSRPTGEGRGEGSPDSQALVMASNLVDRLDHFFTKLNSGPNAETAYMGNEPCEEAPWVYDFAGAPTHTQETVRRIQNELFTNRPDGIPGNDDEAALSSWYVFSALGLYPAQPGTGRLAIGSPLFPKAAIHLKNGSTIQIIGETASTDTPYVQNLTLNGKNWGTSFIDWSNLSNPSNETVLDFTLSKAPSTNDTK